MINYNICNFDIDEEDIMEFIIDFCLCYNQCNYYNIDINNKIKSFNLF